MTPGRFPTLHQKGPQTFPTDVQQMNAGDEQTASHEFDLL